MQVTEIIRKKRDGGIHTSAELEELLSRYLTGEVKDYQMAAWLMAVFFRGLNPIETQTWTRLMWKSGTTFPRPERRGFWVDKHSTGGVGDKTSLILVPLVTAVCRRVLGEKAVRIPMVSGRGLGHSGGTLDKLESVPGFSPAIDLDRAMELIETNGYFMMGQTENLAPADRLIYALRDVTSTVECVPLIVSSIMSKKLSENPDGIVFDVKVGSGAFMKTIDRALELTSGLVGISRSEGVAAVGVLTRMDEPLGNSVGNRLEVEECAAYLRGEHRDAGLHEVTLALAAHMISLSSRGKLSFTAAQEECRVELSKSTTFDLFLQMFESQGGDYAAFEKAESRLGDLHVFKLCAKKSGFIQSIEPMAVGVLVKSLGGGRNAKEDAIDPDVGIVFDKRVGDKLATGTTIARVYYRHEKHLAEIESTLAHSVVVADAPVAARSWILQEVT